MYYSAIGLLAVLLLLIENQDILRMRSGGFDTPAWHAYRKFLFAVLAYYATDILWGILESYKLSGPLFLDTTLYFIAMAIGVLFWTQYTVSYLDEKSGFGRFLLYTGRALCGAVLAASVVNFFVPILFTVDAHCIYQAQTARYVALAAQIALLLLLSGYTFHSMQQAEDTRRKRYRTISLFGIIMATFLFFQLWFPYLPLYAMAYMLGTSLLHAFVVGDEREEYKVGMVAAEDKAREAVAIAELRQSITSLLDNIPGMSFSKDAETGVYRACNQAFAEYAHKESPEDVVGLTDAEIFDAETARHFTEADRIALSMDEPYIFFEDVPDAAGNQRQLQTTKLKYIDSYGRLCTLGMCADITDMVRIQHEYALTKEDYERERSAGIIRAHIAQALAHGYEDLFYVNAETGDFIEYRTDNEQGRLSEVRRGADFFEQCKVEANLYIHPDDRKAFVKALDRQSLMSALDRNKAFVMAYRLTQGNESRYVSMRASRMQDDERFVVIGVSDIDEQMRQRKAVERAAEESIAYARISALAGNYICIYTIDPETGHYLRYSSSESFERYNLPKEGEDFFAAARRDSRAVIYPDDLDRYLTLFNKTAVISEIELNGIFVLRYRIVVEGTPIHVQLKAALIQEKDGPRLIIGLNNIDSIVRQEEKRARELSQAQSQASLDALTGVKNRHAFLQAEEELDRQIRERRNPAFAIVIFDVNDLKAVNDTAGHQAGDGYLRSACKIVCDIFERSPVFRIGGDEFVVIAQGSDYDCIEELLDKVSDHNMQAARTGGIIIACGMAKYESEKSVAPVLERADLSMYENKTSLKAIQSSD